VSDDRREGNIMSKLMLAALAGATLALAPPAYAARGGGAGMGNMAMLASGQVAMKIGSCHQQRCENTRRKPCKVRKGWFAEGLDPLIR
jgi:hypothetical protein